MTDSDPPTREARAPVVTVGLDEEREEVTRAMDRLVDDVDAHPSDADGPTRMVPEAALAASSTEEEVSPADGEGPTRMFTDGDARDLPRAAMRSDPGLGGSGAEAGERIGSDPPPREVTRVLPRSGLIGEDDVPVTEGTALLPRTALLAALADATDDDAAPAPGEQLPGAPAPAAPAPVFPAPASPASAPAVPSAPGSSPASVTPESAASARTEGGEEPATPHAPIRAGWGRATLIFVVTFLATSALLLYLWRAFVQ